MKLQEHIDMILNDETKDWKLMEDFDELKCGYQIRYILKATNEHKRLFRTGGFIIKISDNEPDNNWLAVYHHTMINCSLNMNDVSELYYCTVKKKKKKKETETIKKRQAKITIPKFEQRTDEITPYASFLRKNGTDVLVQYHTDKRNQRRFESTDKYIKAKVTGIWEFK
jgi:hypothetical protein